MVTFVWLEEETGQRGGWRCAAMECGGLSVMEETGTPGMPMWCAGSFTSSMKVSIDAQTSNLHPVFKNIAHTSQY